MKSARASMLAAFLLAVCACGVPAGAVAAEGGPSNNTPVPATTAGTKATPPVTITARSPVTTAPATTTTTPAATTPAATIPASTQPAAVPASTRTRANSGSSGTSTTAIVLGAIGVILIACALAWALLRMRGSDPRWTLSMRHSFAEAAHRASATAAELVDWARLGR